MYSVQVTLVLSHPFNSSRQLDILLIEISASSYIIAANELMMGDMKNSFTGRFHLPGINYQ